MPTTPCFSFSFINCGHEYVAIKNKKRKKEIWGTNTFSQNCTLVSFLSPEGWSLF